MFGTGPNELTADSYNLMSTGYGMAGFHWHFNGGFLVWGTNYLETMMDAPTSKVA